METDPIAMARAYQELKASPAFRELMADLHAESERHEIKALTLDISAPYRDRMTALIIWQEQRRIVKEIEDRIEQSSQTLKQFEQEIENERSIAADRAGRTGW